MTPSALCVSLSKPLTAELGLKVVAPPFIPGQGSGCGHPGKGEALSQGALSILPCRLVQTTSTITDSFFLAIRFGTQTSTTWCFRAHIRIQVDFSRRTLKKRVASSSN